MNSIFRCLLPVLAMAVTSCSHTPDKSGKNSDTLSFYAVCTSNRQEYGDYNLEMSYLKPTGLDKYNYAIKIDNGVVKIYNTNFNQMWQQDTVYLHHEKDGTYMFESTKPEFVNEVGVTELPHKYVFTRKDGTLTYLGLGRYVKDGEQHTYCKAVTFRLECTD